MRDRTQHVLAVIGSGHVGLPTAVSFANAGFKVYAIDTDRELVRQINSGIDPIGEPGLARQIKKNVSAGRLVSTDMEATVTPNLHAVLIAVPTPTVGIEPDLAHLMEAIDNVGARLIKKELVAVISSVPPGTMDGLVRTALEHRSGFKVEKDFYLAYVPERIAPGNALRDIRENPRLVGGVGSISTRVAGSLFRHICRTVIMTEAAVAEVSKLAENTFRDVNIAFANELALLCEKLGVDASQVIEVANTHPRVRIHAPGGGVGGPCLPKDPWLLVHSDRLHDMAPKIIPIAREINDMMPHHVVDLVEQALRSVDKHIKGARLTVLGTAYKSGISDTRLSPSASVIKLLIERGANVVAYDPYSSEALGAHQAHSLNEAVRGSDGLIVMTDHNEFRRIDLGRCKRIMSTKPIIVDSRRILEPQRAKKLGYSYLGVGFGVHLSRQQR